VKIGFTGWKEEMPERSRAARVLNTCDRDARLEPSVYHRDRELRISLSPRGGRFIRSMV
jgi:hypothetical protein